MKTVLDARPSPISGQWYPANAQRLAEQVDNYMEKAKILDLKGEIIALMAPHAGHLYSGPVAGYAFSAVRGLEPDIVAVVSPMHYPYFEPLISSAHNSYKTPLGEIPVDHESLDMLDSFLLSELEFGLTRVGHDQEHSLEIELPFLQRALSKPFRLVPIMVREQSPRVARSLGAALARLFSDDHSRSGLLVASTDLSHFYSQDVAKKLDEEVLRRVEEFDPEGVLTVEEEGKGYACGRGALAAVLWAAKDMGANRARVLHYATSGDVTGDFSRVVGYAAAAITRE